MLVLHTPLLFGLERASRNRVKLSPWVWGALGLAIPTVASLTLSVVDFFQLVARLGPDATSWRDLVVIAWVQALNPETLVFGVMLPMMTGGAAFGWLLFQPRSNPAASVTSD